MASPPKRPRFSSGGGFAGFGTALEALQSGVGKANEGTEVEVGVNDDDSKRKQLKENAAPGHQGGTENSSEISRSVDLILALPKDGANAAKEIPLDAPFTLSLTLRGTNFYEFDVSAVLKSGAAVVLERQPDNEYDANAVRVCYCVSDSATSAAVEGGKEEVGNDETPDGTMTDGTMPADAAGENTAQPTCCAIGHVAKEQAALLAPLIDSESIQFTSVVVEGRNSTDRSAFNLKAEGMARDIGDVLIVLEDVLLSKTPDMNALSRGLAKHDLEESKSAHYSIDQLPEPMPWSPLPDYERDQGKEQHAFDWPWEPFDSSVAPSRFLGKKADVEACQNAKWPPSDDVLRSLGMGPANDADWWNTVAGLKPPTEWEVNGPYDLVGTGIVSLSRQTHRDKAAQELDGAVHGVTNVWTDESLQAIRRAMHEKDFWCYRGNDAFIRSFGGPYVLGQAEGKLKLVQGTPHSSLTSMICRAHNLVYAACHLKLPAAPGFNTIIFGLNLRRAGFHYHQDSIGELKAKNAPLVPRQPVVTTVFYERPDLDDRKEVVNWLPVLNWSPSVEQHKGNSDTANRFYLAARTVRTAHGMIHVQRAGLQARTKHGIFHCPGSEEERMGYRVAITARIAWPDAEKRLEPFMASKSYAIVLGPDGDNRLPASTT